jgi:hypothetical protein
VVPASTRLWPSSGTLYQAAPHIREQPSDAWSRYKPVAHLYAGFALAFQDALREGPDERDERMKNA